MNIFVLSSDPVDAARQQCDRHITKMAVESAQMLSTAHRMLDGRAILTPSKSGKRQVKTWVHPDATLDGLLYKSVHEHHPCTLWTMNSNNNYTWHYIHFTALCDEYTHRYGKVHATDTKLRTVLKQLPRNIPVGYKTAQPLAMGAAPECMNPNDIVGSYRNFYKTKQQRFRMTWTKRDIPDWFHEAA
jgi:hypothetical protein